MSSFTIGYPIHNKGYMMDEIINGLVHSVGDSVHDIKYKFILDGCSDNSKRVLKREMSKLDNAEYIETDDLFQLRTFNLLMADFDTDFLIIFQDDMVLRDTAFLDNILNVYLKYGDRMGMLGCRDGFDAGYKNMSGSRFSESSMRTEVLDSGKYREKMMINIGPIVVTKKLIEAMGYFDEIYGKGVYEEMEYSLRCTLKGLATIVMGVDLIHSKFLYKNKFDIKHTSHDIVIGMYDTNITIFRERWHGIAKI